MGTVTLDRLYRASKVVELPNCLVVVRALSDAERSQIDLDALAAAMRFDKRIKNPESDEYLGYIYPLDEAERDILMEVLALWARSAAQAEAQKQIKDRFIPIPKDASQEERKKVEEDREVSEAAAEKERKDYVEASVGAARAKYDGLPDEALRAEAKARRIQYLSAAETMAERMFRCVFYGTEKMEGGRFFENYGQVKDLDSTVLSTLYREQQEVDGLDPWAVVKFRAGRESDRVVATQEERVGEKGGVDGVVVDLRGSPSATRRKHGRTRRAKS